MRSLAVLLILVSPLVSMAADEAKNDPQSETAAEFLKLAAGKPVAIKAEAPASEPPTFAVAQATQGMSRDFGLDGPHKLVYLSLHVPHVRWTNKATTGKWPFDQPDLDNASAITLYLGGPGWRQQKQSSVVTVDNKKVEREAILKLLAKPTPVLVSLAGKTIDPYYLKVVKPGTLIVILGPRDLELAPRYTQGGGEEKGTSR